MMHDFMTAWGGRLRKSDSMSLTSSTDLSRTCFNKIECPGECLEYQKEPKDSRTLNYCPHSPQAPRIAHTVTEHENSKMLRISSHGSVETGCYGNLIIFGGMHWLLRPLGIVVAIGLQATGYISIFLGRASAMTKKPGGR